MGTTSNLRTGGVAAAAAAPLPNSPRGRGRKFQMVVSPQLDETITRLMLQTGRNTMAEVFRDGIYTLQWVVNEFERKRGGGSISQVPLPAPVARMIP